MKQYTMRGYIARDKHEGDFSDLYFGVVCPKYDPIIIVEQMAFFYGEEDFNKEKERKLLRLKERLAKHKETQLCQR